MGVSILMFGVLVLRVSVHVFFQEYTVSVHVLKFRSTLAMYMKKNLPALEVHLPSTVVHHFGSMPRSRIFPRVIRVSTGSVRIVYELKNILGLLLY
jgi:hypothetical protein